MWTVCTPVTQRLPLCDCNCVSSCTILVLAAGHMAKKGRKREGTTDSACGNLAGDFSLSFFDFGPASKSLHSKEVQQANCKWAWEAKEEKEEDEEKKKKKKKLIAPVSCWCYSLAIFALRWWQASARTYSGISGIKSRSLQGKIKTPHSRPERI